MKTAREFYDAILDCEGDIQGTILIETRDREVRAAALRDGIEAGYQCVDADDLSDALARAGKGEP